MILNLSWTVLLGLYSGVDMGKLMWNDYWEKMQQRELKLKDVQCE